MIIFPNAPECTLDYIGVNLHKYKTWHISFKYSVTIYAYKNYPKVQLWLKLHEVFLSLHNCSMLITDKILKYLVSGMWWWVAVFGAVQSILGDSGSTAETWQWETVSFSSINDADDSIFSSTWETWHWETASLSCIDDADFSGVFSTGETLQIETSSLSCIDDADFSGVFSTRETFWKVTASLSGLDTGGCRFSSVTNTFRFSCIDDTGDRSFSSSMLSCLSSSHGSF